MASLLPFHQFNSVWDGWLKTLKCQMPELDFENVYNVSYLAKEEGLEKPMYYFMTYTSNSLDKICQNDMSFFDDLESVSGGLGLPFGFLSHFNSLNTEQKAQAWATLRVLVELVGRVKTEVHQDYIGRFKNCGDLHPGAKQVQ